MNGQHTPGPWIVAGEHGEFVSQAGTFMPIASVNVPVAVDYRAAKTVAGTRAEQLTNARLIAAAPELLAALKEAEDLFSAEYTYSNGEVISNTKSVGGMWVTQARAAIAKAEGREP